MSLTHCDFCNAPWMQHGTTCTPKTIAVASHRTFLESSYNAGFDAGFAAAREAAAKVCHDKDSKMHKQLREANRQADYVQADTLNAILQESAAIADEIRALKPEEPKVG